MSCFINYPQIAINFPQDPVVILVSLNFAGCDPILFPSYPADVISSINVLLYFNEMNSRYFIFSSKARK